LTEKKVKITVVKIFEPKDVIGKDFIRESGKSIPKCPFFEEGNEFIVPESGKMPEDFCQHAYHAIYRNLDVLRLGGTGYSDWTGEGIIYSACNDGIRPVCFKLEQIQ